jgi:hypothetical protein
MISSWKARVRSDSSERDKIKQKELVGTFGANKSQEDKIEEISRIIKYLSNKLDRMEIKRGMPHNINPNQFRRPFNPPQVL